MNAQTLAFRKSPGQIVLVDSENPLPVEMHTILDRVEVLRTNASFLADTASKDLAGSTNAETPTVVEAAKYQRLVLTLKNLDTITHTYNIRVLAREASDSDPNTALSSGWLTVLDWSTQESRLSVPASAWLRVSFADGLYFDQYRILVWSQNISGTPTIAFKLKGVIE